MVSVVLIAVPATAVGPLGAGAGRTRPAPTGRRHRADAAGPPSADASAGNRRSAAVDGPTAAGGRPGAAGAHLAAPHRRTARRPGPGRWPSPSLGGLAAALFVAPSAGALVGAVVLLELLVDRSRIVVVAGTVGLLVATAGYVALHQHRNAFVPDINWPAHMGLANSLVWVAVFLLAADGLVAWVQPAPDGGPGAR